MKYNLSQISNCQNAKIAVPNIIHFVWIGDTNQVNTKYIDIWKKTNKEKVIYFWYDEHSFLTNCFHESIKQYILLNGIEDKIQAEINIKNKAFNYMFPKLMQGVPFDKLIVDFLFHNNIPVYGVSEIKSNKWFERKEIVTKNINELFKCNSIDFMKYYYYEVILKGNLAGASDIARLLIIYAYGGVYIDVDTLPYTDNIFKRANNYIEKENFTEREFISLFKTSCILHKLAVIDLKDNEYLTDYKSHFGKDKGKWQAIQELIELDVSDFSITDISPLGELYVYKNLLSIGSIKRLRGIYFNNVIVSHKNAKAIRIILHNIKKRYKYLEKNDCIFNIYEKGEQENYLTRILTWRTELLTKNYCVTTALTGPGLIVEVLLGLAYELLDITELTCPSYMAEYLQNDNFGLAFFQHNIDTPDNINSSWRK